VRPVEASAHVRFAEIAPSKGRLRPLGFEELWRYRDLAVFLALRDVKLRYRQTFFGVTWAVLQPLAAAAVFVLVFNTAVSIPSEGFPYLILVFAGLLAWQVFSTGLGAAATTLVEDQDLVTRVYFPRLAALIAALLPSLIDLAVSLVVLAVLMVAYDVGPGLALLTLPLWLGALLVLTLGAGALLSALNVQYRDVRYTLVFLTQLWFFASPVIFPSSLVEGGARLLLAVNPLCGVLDGWRWALIDAPPPPPADLISLASGILLVVTGILYFRATEHRFADVI
jgi:lipopolysaccharide transport system permease protein